MSGRATAGRCRADACLVAALVSVTTGGCGGAPKSAVVRVNPAACQPMDFASLTSFSLRGEAPLLEGGGWRYRCVVFVGDSGRRAELTVFANGFRPEVYLLDPGSGPTLLAWSRTGPGEDVARVSFTLPRNAAYAAVVTTVNGGESGSFLLSIQHSP